MRRYAYSDSSAIVFLSVMYHIGVGRCEVLVVIQTHDTRSPKKQADRIE